MKWFLFETRPGEWLLALIERALGLAVVSVDDLRDCKIAQVETIS